MTGADQEHCLPAKGRHDTRADLAGRHETNGKDHLVEHEEPAAADRLRQLIDIRGRDGHVAADTDALYESRCEQCVEVAGERASQAHDRHDEHSCSCAASSAETLESTFLCSFLRPSGKPLASTTHHDLTMSFADGT